MWPNLLGPGWGSELLFSFGILGAVIALAFFLEVIFGTREDSEDPLLLLWHRYEQGDLTRQEFVRIKRAHSLARDRARRWEKPMVDPRHLRNDQGSRNSARLPLFSPPGVEAGDVRPDPEPQPAAR